MLDVTLPLGRPTRSTRSSTGERPPRSSAARPQSALSAACSAAASSNSWPRSARHQKRRCPRTVAGRITSTSSISRAWLPPPRIGVTTSSWTERLESGGPPRVARGLAVTVGRVLPLILAFSRGVRPPLPSLPRPGPAVGGRGRAGAAGPARRARGETLPAEPCHPSSSIGGPHLVMDIGEVRVTRSAHFLSATGPRWPGRGGPQARRGRLQEGPSRGRPGSVDHGEAAAARDPSLVVTHRVVGDEEVGTRLAGGPHGLGVGSGDDVVAARRRLGQRRGRAQTVAGDGGGDAVERHRPQPLTLHLDPGRLWLRGKGGDHGARVRVHHVDGVRGEVDQHGIHGVTSTAWSSGDLADRGGGRTRSPRAAPIVLLWRWP